MTPRICIILLLFCAGCATKPKRYKAPDPTAVLAASSRLAKAVNDASVLAVRAETTVVSAKREAERVKAAADEARVQLDNLFRLTPPELKPMVDEVNAKVETMRAAQVTLLDKLAESTSVHAALSAQLREADDAKQQFAADGERYLAEANKLAGDAISERNARIKAEKSLSWYRWHWWGSWIALGAGILLSLIFAFLKFTGRLALRARA